MNPLDVACPICLSWEGFRCTTNWEFREEYRRPTKPHAARVRAAANATKNAAIKACLEVKPWTL